MSIFEVNDLCLWYGSHQALKDININVEEKAITSLIGPSGCGKTEIARAIAKIIGVPFCICDATTVTQAGYVGDDVENMLLRLLQAADMDLNKAQCGIIYIDEIDKIARKGENASLTRDVSGEGVQQALLKILEGSEVDLALTYGRKHPNAPDRVRFNTENVLFICGGAFEGLTMRKNEKNAIGFTKTILEDSTAIDRKDIVKQGIIPELIGRLPIITVLDELTENDLKRILTEPKNAIIKQYNALLSLDGVKLIWDESVLTYIAKRAKDEGPGARGLRSIIEETMTDLMFTVPDDDIKCDIIVTVENNEIICEKAKSKRTGSDNTLDPKRKIV